MKDKFLHGVNLNRASEIHKGKRSRSSSIILHQLIPLFNFT